MLGAQVCQQSCLQVWDLAVALNWCKASGLPLLSCGRLRLRCTHRLASDGKDGQGGGLCDALGFLC